MNDKELDKQAKELFDALNHTDRPDIAFTLIYNKLKSVADQQPWISVEKELPPINIDVLTINSEHYYNSDRLLKEDLWLSENRDASFFMDTDTPIPRVTHWQHFPDPPTSSFYVN